uniref:Candidate secreted effector n=1 Tax=Meloidogyne incognita TaxID=6306 RepID=A0A914MVQ3_MELIC
MHVLFQRGKGRQRRCCCVCGFKIGCGELISLFLFLPFAVVLLSTSSFAVSLHLLTISLLVSSFCQPLASDETVPLYLLLRIVGLLKK